jgi:hypothetical protein
MIKVTVTFCNFPNVPRITPFRASAGSIITEQPTLVRAQGTVYQKSPLLTGNHTLFLTENSPVWCNKLQGNSQVPPEMPNSDAQQPRQTQQKEAYQ